MRRGDRAAPSPACRHDPAALARPAATRQQQQRSSIYVRSAFWDGNRLIDSDETRMMMAMNASHDVKVRVSSDENVRNYGYM